MKRLKRIWKKNVLNIVIMVAFALIIGTVPVSANVSDNLGSSIDKILGPVNASLSGNFNTSSTNGKLNQMKKDVSEAKDSMETLLAPYLSNLTVWVDSTNASYRGKTVSATNSKGEKETASFVLKNGHYEATFSKLVRNTYKIAYPFILSSGKQLNLAAQFELSSGNNTKQLFGDLQKMSMDDIQAACKAGAIQSVAKVGDTISDGTYTYTIIGINQDKPCDANGNLLGSDSYGDVLTLMALGAPAGAGDGTPVKTNLSKTPNNGVQHIYGACSESEAKGWETSDIRTKNMKKYLESLPQETQRLIGYVQKTTGIFNGIDSYGKKVSQTSDKCFLLSVKEIVGEDNSWYNATQLEKAANTQYQYFETIATTEASRAFTTSWAWFTRSPSVGQVFRVTVIYNGKVSDNNSVMEGYTIIPAFCIY